MSHVTLRDVSVSYDARRVVHGLDLDAHDGEWLALIGPNGAGKTTVLRAIAGLVRHTGRAAIGDAPIATLGAKELARRVAFVHQDPLMPAGMTVAHYVMLGRTAHISYFGSEGSADRRVVTEVLDRLSLRPLAERLLDQLSGGERQRAAIARALAQQAPVLLLDEPTRSLDIGSQQEVLELVDTLRRDEGLTVIAAMHDLTLAGQYADRLALLVAGTLIAVGRPDEVLSEESIAAHYRADVRLVKSAAGIAVVPVRSTRIVAATQVQS
jgi:iron complex transport system ATP-binding protein